MGKETREPGRIWFKLRGIMAAPLFLLSLYIKRGRVNIAWITFPAGIITFLMGVFIRTWSEMHIRYRLKGHKVLATTGPYAYMRNPLYVGNTLILTGIPMLMGLLWFVPLTVISSLINYSLSIRYEEPHLVKKYGEPYIKYLETTPRWIPKIWPSTMQTKEDLKDLIIPSIKSEAHTLLLLIPVIIVKLWNKR